MKHARRVSRHLDDLRMVWRQAEAAIDRVESARDADAVGRRKTDALLAAASAIERLRTAAGLVAQPLGDAVVDTLPTNGWDLTTGQFVSGIDAWSTDVRPGRLPGSDEVELAVADIATARLPSADGDPTSLPEVSGDLLLAAVRLPPRRDTLEVELDGELGLLQVPSYPGWGSSLPADGDVGLAVASLFDLGPRRNAAVAESMDEEFVATWSSLVARRRGVTPAVFTGAAAAATPFGAEVRTTAAKLVADVAARRADRLPVGAHAGAAATVAQAAAAAAATASTDADVLEAAATVLDEEGVDSTAEDLPGLLRAAAAHAGDADAMSAVAAAAFDLADLLEGVPVGFWGVPNTVAAGRAAAAAILQEAVAALPGAGSLPSLLALPTEDGPLAAELDVVVADRVAYPDGTLRLLRAIEVGFGRFWPMARRQLRLRAGPRGPLTRAMTRFLGVFVGDLTALVDGRPTSFGAGPLTTVQPTNVGAVSLLVDAPASSSPSIDAQIEVGQIAVLRGERPATAVVVGTRAQGEQLTLRTAPVRVSRVPADIAPGAPGLVDAGVQVTAAAAGGVTQAELRRGFADEPARDGLVEEAVALASQLALLAGSSLVTRGGAPIVPSPSGGPLERVEWHGNVPRMTVSFVLQGVAEQWWDRSTPDEPLPLLVRPGELLLLRGTVNVAPPDAEPTAGAVPQVAQAAIEVDRAVRISGRMLSRLELTRTAVLAADMSRLGEVGQPRLICGHDEDLVLVTLRRTWQARPLMGPVTLRRDFAGFDLLTLAAHAPMGDTLIQAVTGTSPPPELAAVDRRGELDAAAGLLEEWLRYSR